MASAAYNLYGRLSKRIEELHALCKEAGRGETQESIYRACLVLTVASLDAYVHEKAAELYSAALRGPTPPATKMSTYLGVPAQNLQQASRLSLIRYRLSFKTLVFPDKIDEAIEASGVSAPTVWRSIGIDSGARESRLRNALQLQVDRRNQIAHEGDWDVIDFDFRHISSSHVYDCAKCISGVVEGLERNWTT
jgi:hypothetical protein